MTMRGGLEGQIGEWRGYLSGRNGMRASDIEELEDHLRGQVDGLVVSGLNEEEAFLIAVKRMGALDDLSREFAREHSERLWKQLVVLPAGGGEESGGFPRDLWLAIALAVGAAASFQIPRLFGLDMTNDPGADFFYVRNVAFFVLPFLTAFFVWKRQIGLKVASMLGLAFGAAAVVANSYPLVAESDTAILFIIHLPMALWLVVGVAYAGGQWRNLSKRMDFVRFTGELFIYYVLIALGGGVLMGLTFGMFEAIGIDVEEAVGTWLIPSGALGAVIIGSWLVEAKQGVIENMAPVLTRVFTPLFVATLLTFLVTMLWTGQTIDRNVLIAFDLLLAVVAALLLYSISARDADRPPGFFDSLLIVLLFSALAVDLFALAAIAGRITDFGFTPNRVAALGENILLLVHLAGSAWLYLRFVRGESGFAVVERWQTRYLPVYPIWAAAVAIAFPLIFGFR